jgi:hypothetical protein
VVDTPFTSYAFKATPQDASQVARTLPSRLNDVINVKDLGAKGDGITDDTSAINSAIDYLYTLSIPNPNVDLHGAVLFFPPGLYQITGQFFLDRGPTAGHRAYYGVMGAGRDVSVLRGNFNMGNQTPDTNNSFLVKCARWGNQVSYIRDLTIQNQSTAATSGALEIESLAWFGFSIVNCHIIGNVGVSVDVSNFGTSIRDCIFTCSKPITTADASTRSPLFSYSNFQDPPAGPGGGQLHLGSVGLFINQGAVINCHFTGFDIGMSTSHLPMPIIGCSMSRCGIGIVTSLREGSGNIGNFNDFGGGVIQGAWNWLPQGAILANKIDRCTWGIHNYAASNLLVSANRVMGTSGPYDPATIQNVVFSGGTATVTTTNAHNLPAGTSKLVLVTSPAGWTPDGTGDQIVSCTNTGSSTFTYSLSADPGSFTSANWNYSLETAIISRRASTVAYIANTLDARVSNASFDMNHSQSPGPVGFAFTFHNIVYATLGPYGWILSDDRVKASYQFVQCGTPTNNPVGIPFSTLPDGSAGGTGNEQPGPMEGQEYTVTGCSLQNSFAGVVTGGGSNHYKVRYDGTNWIRVG